MTIFKCKSCGGTLEISNETVATCEYCTLQQTLPTAKDENLQGLFNRANVLRMKSEFDKAEQLYEKIIEKDDTQAEAYWGLILCKYGIEYVEDPVTFKRIPTCHRTSYESIIADEDYKSAIKYADSFQKAIYEEEAKEIDRIQKEILELSKKEEPYDVFICYKETDDAGIRTQDSVIANDIYYQLTQEGLKVFYAAITLEDKLGSAYEPCIFAALNSAKAMLVIGTKPEYFNAVWVKNEWSRFLKIIQKDRSKLLIPCYRDMDAYELPEEFAHLQAQNMSKIGFINDIVRGIKKITSEDKIKQMVGKDGDVTTVSPNIESLLKRAFMFLEDGDFTSADEYCEKVLDIDPENGQAYLGKFLSQFKLTSIEAIKDIKETAQIIEAGSVTVVDFGSEKLKAIKFIKEATGLGLKEAKDIVDTPSVNLKLDDSAIDCLIAIGAKVKKEKYSFSKTVSDLKKSIHYNKFVRFGDTKAIEKVSNLLDALNNSLVSDAKSTYRNTYLQTVQNLHLDNISKFNAETIQVAITALLKYKGYMDADEKISVLRDELAKNNRYNKYLGIFTGEIEPTLQNLTLACSSFEQLGEYKDSRQKKVLCENKISEIEEQRIYHFLNKNLEPLSALQIRDSDKPKISKVQTRLENMAKKGLVEKIKNNNITRYSLYEYKILMRIEEINKQIIEHQNQVGERIQEEIDASIIYQEIIKLCDKKKTLSIFNIRDKKEVQEEIDRLRLEHTKLIKKAELIKSAKDVERKEQIDTLMKEKYKLEQQIKKS